MNREDSCTGIILHTGPQFIVFAYNINACDIILSFLFCFITINFHFYFKCVCCGSAWKPIYFSIKEEPNNHDITTVATSSEVTKSQTLTTKSATASSQGIYKPHRSSTPTTTTTTATVTSTTSAIETYHENESMPLHEYDSEDYKSYTHHTSTLSSEKILNNKTVQVVRVIDKMKCLFLN